MKGQYYYDQLTPSQQREYAIEAELRHGDFQNQALKMFNLPKEFAGLLSMLQPDNKPYSLSEDLSKEYTSGDNFISSGFILHRSKSGSLYWRDIASKLKEQGVQEEENGKISLAQMLGKGMKMYKEYLKEKGVDPRNSSLSHEVILRRLQMNSLTALKEIYIVEKDISEREVYEILLPLIPCIMKYVQYLYDSEFRGDQKTDQ